MKRYNKTKNRRNNKNKTKRKRRNTFRMNGNRMNGNRMNGNRMKINTMKGGNINPFSEIGTAVSSLTSYLQSSIGSLSVPAIQGSQPVNASAHPTQQYLGSALNNPVSNVQSMQPYNL
jgi:hypothetical protein